MAFVRRQDYPINSIILEKVQSVGPAVRDGESLMSRVRMFNEVCTCNAEVLVIAGSRVRTFRDTFVGEFESISFRAADGKWVNPWVEVPDQHLYLVSRGRASPLL